MGVHDKEVVAIIGQGTWDIIINSVKTGVINKQMLEDIAQSLGSSISGKHRWRMDTTRPEGEAEMRAILTDWYEQDMHDFTTEKAVQRLVDVLGEH